MVNTRWMVQSRVETPAVYHFETRTARNVIGLVRALLDVRRQGEALILVEWRPR